MPDASSDAGGPPSSHGGDERALTTFMQKQRYNINSALEKLITRSDVGPLKESLISAKARDIGRKLDEIEGILCWEANPRALSQRSRLMLLLQHLPRVDWLCLLGHFLQPLLRRPLIAQAREVLAARLLRPPSIRPRLSNA